MVSKAMNTCVVTLRSETKLRTEMRRVQYSVTHTYINTSIVALEHLKNMSNAPDSSSSSVRIPSVRMQLW